MRRLILVSAAVLATCLLGAQPGTAQSGSPSASGVAGSAESSTAKAARAPRGTRAKKEPTVGQMAARERQRKCGAEWKEAKAANRAGGMKWPAFWSRCNARLKGNEA